MDFENTFTVQAPIDEVYEALLDLERVAPAMPGAKVLEQTGDDSYKVAIKVKLGPMTMTYKGDVSIVERDPEAHTALLDVKAKEARGQGSANAKVNMSLVEQDGATVGTMNANVRLAGKAASMGRGVIEDVSKRLVSTFASNLEDIVAAPDGKDEPVSQEAEPAAAPAPSSSQPEPDDEGLPVLPLAAGIVADRLKDPKVIAGLLVVGFLIWRRS